MRRIGVRLPTVGVEHAFKIIRTVLRTIALLSLLVVVWQCCALYHGESVSLLIINKKREIKGAYYLSEFTLMLHTAVLLILSVAMETFSRALIF